MSDVPHYPHKVLTSEGNASKYDTKLTPQQDKGYSKWQDTLPKDMDRSGEDYDLKGAYAAGEKPGETGHLTDKFKKPNHPTFSDESQLSGEGDAAGGHWSGPAPGIKPGAGEEGRSWTFKAGPANLAAHSAKELGDYFRDKEPNSILAVPLDDIPGAKKAP